MDPITSINALIEPSITLGHIALLEKIQSPLLKGSTIAADVIPGLYLLSRPSAKGAQCLDTLTSDAFQWADTLSIQDYRTHLSNALHAISSFFGLLPQQQQDTKKKEPQSPQMD